MGLIKSTEQDNGNLLLEILYGGKEAPFGGVDTSAPPAYIDPRCFTASDGFLVIDNKIVATSFQPAAVPTLWNSVTGVMLLKFGTFYNSLTGQLNYALGYKIASFGSPGTSATGVTYTFYMTSWNPGNPAFFWTDVLPVTLYDAQSIVEQASIILDCIVTGTSLTYTSVGGNLQITSVSGTGAIAGYTLTGGTGYSVGQFVQVIQVTVPPMAPAIINSSAVIQINTIGGGGSIATSTLVASGNSYYDGIAYPNNIQGTTTSLQINGPAGGPTTYSVSPQTLPNFTRQGVVTALVAAINAGPDPNVKASASIDGYSIILTAIAGGAVGNSITVQDVSISSASAIPPTFYFSATTARNLQGGQITESSDAPRQLGLGSTVDVGGTLYIAGLGPMILQYSGPGEFTTATMYNGVNIIKKFAGSLLGLGLVSQLGVFTQNQDMILAWTTAGNLGEWAPVTLAGNVTGAGFEQLADIGDYLTGIIVSNATAFIIRAQGVSYATATGNATLPFAVSHIGLGDRGEGCQVPGLICQYDQVGAFVGNTDVFQVAGSISSIGEKIKALLFSLLSSQAAFSTACAVSIGGDEFILLVFQLANHFFIFNTSNGTWMVFTLSALGQVWGIGCFSSVNTLATAAYYDQSFMIFAEQFIDGHGVLQAPSFYALKEGVPNNTSPSSPCSVTFPQEEVVFGRDISLDALYVSLWANVSENVAVNFYVTLLQNVAAAGLPNVYESVTQLYASYVLTPAVFNSLSGNPIELQLFPDPSYGAGAFTGHSPQLNIQIASISDAGTAQVRFSKKAIFASVDPAQRPV